MISLVSSASITNKTVQTSRHDVNGCHQASITIKTLDKRAFYQGLVSKRTNKLKSVEFQNIFESHDVILLTECWTNQLSELTVNNFESIVLHRQENKKNSKRNSGGLVLYIRK